MAPDLPAPSVAPEQVRAVLEDVLSRREYTPLRPSLFDRAREWLLEQLGMLLDGLGGTGGLLSWLVIAAVGAAFLYAAVWLLRGVRPDRALTASGLAPTGRTAADWSADAARHERAGDWRQALRCRYGELLAELAAAGLVEDAPGRTTGEHLTQIRRSVPAAAAPAAALTAVFEAVWYGRAVADRARVDALAASAAEVRREAGLRRSRPLQSLGSQR